MAHRPVPFAKKRKSALGPAGFERAGCMEMADRWRYSERMTFRRRWPSQSSPNEKAEVA